MDKKRLSAILEAYGADPARWPAAERAAASALADSEPSLATERSAAAVLDRLLAKAPAGMVDDTLRARVLETAPAPKMRALPRGGRRVRSVPGFGEIIRIPSFGPAAIARPVAILAIAVCLGLGAGVLLPSGVSSSSGDATQSDTEVLSALWGSPAITQDGANL